MCAYVCVYVSACVWFTLVLASAFWCRWSTLQVWDPIQVWFLFVLKFLIILRISNHFEFGKYLELPCLSCNRTYLFLCFVSYVLFFFGGIQVFWTVVFTISLLIHTLWWVFTVDTHNILTRHSLLYTFNKILCSKSRRYCTQVRRKPFKPALYSLKPEIRRLYSQRKSVTYEYKKYQKTE